MEERPYLGPGSPLPPSSPYNIQVSSPLTEINERQDYGLTMHPSSPLSSPPESPTPAPRNRVMAIDSWTQSPVLEVAAITEPDDNFVRSSPIRSREDVKRKAKKQRERNREARAKQNLEREEMRRTKAFKECLKILSTNNLKFSELTEYVLFHDDQPAQWRYKNFFADGALIAKLLDLFVSRKVNKQCRKAVKAWAGSLVLETNH